jgi:hypothetical protein
VMASAYTERMSSNATNTLMLEARWLAVVGCV